MVGPHRSSPGYLSLRQFRRNRKTQSTCPGNNLPHQITNELLPLRIRKQLVDEGLAAVDELPFLLGIPCEQLMERLPEELD